MSFKTFEEIKAEIVADVSKDLEEKQAICSYKKEELINLHHSLGQWIRNTYKLWHEENPLTQGYQTDSTKHPDEISQKLIEEVWSHFNGTS